MIVGPNGHGKTSLIEAMLYAEVFRSFRGAADRELVRFGSDGFRVEAVVRSAVRGSVQTPQTPQWYAGSSEQRQCVAAGYDARTRQKKVTVDGLEPPRLGDAIGVVRGVVLSPGDVALVAGGPRERRRYLDVVLALTARGYLEALTRYRRALRQRARATLAEWPAWEQLLAESGAVIVAARQAWADAWVARYDALCGAMGETGTPLLAYTPRLGGEPGDGLADTLRAALERSRDRDRALGHTTVGPHRDELRLTLDGHPLRTYGSAGQQRTAALALRLVEAEAMAASGGEALLCLDDAFAELDADRSRKLAELIAARAAEGSQIVAAVPRESDVPAVIGDLPRWLVREGAVGSVR